jgi:hypothetical protein
MAEGVGFEPTDSCESPVFKAGATHKAYRAQIRDESERSGWQTNATEAVACIE